MNLYIIYGSETLLLKPLIEYIRNEDKSYCIRIFNKRIPKREKNFFDIQSDSRLNSSLENKLNEMDKDIKRIIFVGAGSIMQQSLFWPEKKDVIEKSIDVNIKNYLYIIQIILKFMMRKKNGCFIYLSSFRAIKPTKGTLIYSGSKAFNEAFFKGIGLEYGSLNITSHIIRMGAFDGRMMHALGDDYNKKINKKISSSRLGTAEELCNAIKFCIENPYQNSGVLEINGGLDIDL